MILWTPNLQHFGTGGGFKESANASVAVDVECGNIMEHPCDKKNVQTCKAWGANFPYACIGDILLQSQHPHSCNLVHDRIHPLACRPHMGQERKVSPIGFKADIVLISSIGTNSVCVWVCVCVRVFVWQYVNMPISFQWLSFVSVYGYTNHWHHKWMQRTSSALKGCHCWLLPCEQTWTRNFQ